MRALGLLALIGLLGMMTGAEARRAQKPKGKTEKGKTEKGKTTTANVDDLHYEVNALNVLSALQVSPRQMKTMQTVVATTMQKPPPVKKVKVSERFLKTLRGLRDALMANDQKEIEKQSAQMDALRAKESPEIDDVDITAAARKSAPTVLRIFSARQVAGYLSSVSEFPDPLDALRAGFQQSRKLKGADWQAFRDRMADEVGWLVAGVDAEAEEKVRDKATALLDRAAKLSDKDFTAERSKLDSDARALIGKLGPTDVIRNYMERMLAELLSNYRLGAVIDAKLKQVK